MSESNQTDGQPDDDIVGGEVLGDVYARFMERPADDDLYAEISGAVLNQRKMIVENYQKVDAMLDSIGQYRQTLSKVVDRIIIAREWSGAPRYHAPPSDLNPDVN